MMSIDDDAIKRLEARSYDISKEVFIHRTPVSIPDQNPIISVEKAIEPLIDFLPNLQSFLSIAKEKCLNAADGLTQDESASIMLYSMHWEPTEQCLYYVLNSALRSNDREQLKPWFPYLTLFLKALSHLPSVSLPVYRQVELDLSEQYPVGQAFTWRAFSLCSFSNKTISCTVFTIEGHSGKDIRKHSYFPNDDQIIFTPATEFQVISSLQNDNNQHIIHLKEIQSTYPLVPFTHTANRSEILSASLLLNTFHTNIQSISRVETMEKYIDRSLKLQMRIDKYALYSAINLTNENLDDQDISLVIQHAIVKKQCKILRLDENFLTCEGMTILANSLHYSKSLIGLNLYSNRLFDKGLHPLVQILSNNTSILQKLHLGANRISDKGVLLLADMLKINTTLTVLRLDSNRISDQGVHYLSYVLIHQNNTLQELSLRKNKLITSLSMPDFIEIFQSNQSLTQLDISRCRLTKQDNQHLKNLADENKRFLFQFDREEGDDCVLS